MQTHHCDQQWRYIVWLKHIVEVCGLAGRAGRTCFIQGQGFSGTGMKQNLKDVGMKQKLKEQEVTRQRQEDVCKYGSEIHGEINTHECNPQRTGSQWIHITSCPFLRHIIWVPIIHIPEVLQNQAAVAYSSNLKKALL